MSLMDVIKLIRPWQWYKNVVVFLAIVFVGQLTSIASLTAVILTAIAFCLISSSNYVINDILDAKKDKLNPEKKSRPIASGNISILTAVFIAIILLVAGLGIALYTGIAAALCGLGLFVLTTIYSIWLKHEPIADILAISINFVLRALAGAFAISVEISPWLVTGTFFLALFLATAKRHSEVAFLKESAKEHRQSLNFYTPQITLSLMNISTTLVIVTYALSSFLGTHQRVIWTMPFFLYGIFRYNALVTQGSPIGRKTHKIITDKRMLITGILWVITTIYAIYGF